MEAARSTAIGKTAWSWYTAAIATLLLACYWRTLAATAQLLFQTDDMTHAVFAPVVAAYIVWSRKEDWPARAIAPDIRGVVLLLIGAATAVLALLGESLTLSRVAFLVSLTGCIWATCGSKILRFLLFPLALLLFTFPMPSPFSERLALPLQAISTRGAEDILYLLRIPVTRDGNLLYLPSHTVVVSQVCSGVQALITLTFFCFVYSYWNERYLWPRIAVAAAAIPASILMNILRVAATGLLGEVNHRYAVGTWHTVLGYITFVLGFLLVWGVHRLFILLRSSQVCPA